MLQKLDMITCCCAEIFPTYPFIPETTHDTVSMLHSVEVDSLRSSFFMAVSPLGLRGLMKSTLSFIKIRGWGLIIKIKIKKSRRKNKLLLTALHLISRMINKV